MYRLGSARGESAVALYCSSILDTNDVAAEIYYTTRAAAAVAESFGEVVAAGTTDSVDDNSSSSCCSKAFNSCPLLESLYSTAGCQKKGDEETIR